MPRDTETVLDMLLAAQAIQDFIHGVSFETFSSNREKQSAVSHQLMILGEACKRLSAGFRDQHPHLPWAGIAGMRDRLIHVYDDVDLSLVWDAVHREFPRITIHLQALAPKP